MEALICYLELRVLGDIISMDEVFQLSCTFKVGSGNH